jgi:hypothetical protein
MVKLFAVSWSAFVIGLVMITCCSAQDAKKESAPPMFKKYLGIYTKNSPQQQLILHDATVKYIGERAFLVGAPVLLEENSTKVTVNKDVRRWVALSEVVEFYEFEDLKGYRYDGKEPR